MRAVAFQGRCLPGTYPSVVALGGLGELCSPNNTSFPLPPLWGGREGKARKYVPISGAGRSPAP